MTEPGLLMDARWKGANGLGRFSAELIKRLQPERLLDSRLPPLHPANCFWLSWELWRRPPAVFFTPGFNPPWRSPVPFVFTLGDLTQVRNPEEASPRKQSYYKLIIRPALHRAARVLTFSQHSKKEIQAWGQVPEERISVVGCGVGPEFNPGGECFRPGYRYILSIGNNKPHKNRRRLLQAYLQSGLDREGIHLIFSGTENEELRQLTAAHELAARVHFSGEIGAQDLPAYYRGALAMAFPSLYEGFGLPPLEAMACGTPVLTSNLTSLPEVVAQAALCVDPYDVEALRAGLRAISHDASLRQSLRTAGLSHVRSYTWEACAGKVAAVLASIKPGTGKAAGQPPPRRRGERQEP